MKRYNPNAPCPKCGNAHVRTQHTNTIAVGGYATTGDAIHRNCLRCGYGWYEAPLDAPTGTLASLNPEVEP